MRVELNYYILIQMKLIYMNVQEILIYNISYARPRRRWEDNIKMDFFRSHPVVLQY
jgi:hypothetical protein